MIITDQLHSLPMAVIAVFVALIGLVIGSFLNVLIHRLPRMLQRDWRRDCQEFLELPQEPHQTQSGYNLAFPGSHCPQCRHPIPWYHNIPLLSYLFLRGHCAYCGAAISWRYPLVEVSTAILSVVVFYHYGVSDAALFALLLTWGLIALAVIDIEHQILPDPITLGLLWLGLLVSLDSVFVEPASAILGATFGYVSLWLVYQLFKLLTGKEGMGFGDFKLLAVAGAWLGWQYLLMVILLASLLGSVIGISLISSGRLERSKPIPFGPYLALATWVCLLWGQPLLDHYRHWAGF